jgi:adenylate kinase family enzyme/GNAT superfamily N-acetyltransferase
VRRISVVGNLGSGKTTVARALAVRLGVTAVELDAIHHQRNWVPLPRHEFRTRVAEVVAERSWVVDGNYSAVRDLVWARADTVVWLDLPRHVTMRRLTLRTVRRVLTRQELWNGNREGWRNLFTLDPNESPIREGWRKHGERRERYTHARADPINASLRFVQLRSPRAVTALLDGVFARDARPDEVRRLEELQRRASLVWDEDRPFVLAHPDAIRVESDWIARGHVRVATRGGRIVGFSVVLPRAEDVRELDGLFVEPDVMQEGIGRTLVDDLVAIAREEGVCRIDVVANFRAQGFYEKVGFVADRRVPTRFNDALAMHRDLD